MLAVSASTLQVVDIGLLAAGGVCIIGFMVWLARAGRWRNPLAGVAVPEQGPSAPTIVGLALAFVVVPPALMDAFTRGAATEEIMRPGSLAWHWAQAADITAKTALSVLMAVVLIRAGWIIDPGWPKTWPLKAAAMPLAGRRGGVWRGVALGLMGALAGISLMAGQVNVETAIWRWVWPDASLPTHPVLLALKAGTWGTWGTVQLLAGAVLVAPVAEELLFRGVLLQALFRHLRSGWAAILISSIAFGGVHINQPQDVLPLVTMGVILGYLRLRGGSLLPCIVMHMLFNARTMILTLLASQVPRY